MQGSQMPQITNLDKPLAPDPIPASPKTNSNLEWEPQGIRKQLWDPTGCGFSPQQPREHPQHCLGAQMWLPISRVFKMALCELLGSQSKGDVGSVITQGLGYFGSAFLFPLGCFKFAMLLSNPIELCSEEPWELSWGSAAVGWLSLRALCHWIAMDTPLLLFLCALGRGGKAG